MIHLRTQTITAVTLQRPELLDMTHHTHNLIGMRPARLVPNEMHVLADRVLSREVALRKVLVDDHHTRRILVVGIGQESTAQQRRLHQPQILRLDHVFEGHRQLGLVFRRNHAIHPKFGFIVSAHWVSAPIERRRLHARH